MIFKNTLITKFLAGMWPLRMVFIGLVGSGIQFGDVPNCTLCKYILCFIIISFYWWYTLILDCRTRTLSVQKTPIDLIADGKSRRGLVGGAFWLFGGVSVMAPNTLALVTLPNIKKKTILFDEISIRLAPIGITPQVVKQFYESVLPMANRESPGRYLLLNGLIWGPDDRALYKMTISEMNRINKKNGGEQEITCLLPYTPNLLKIKLGPTIGQNTLVSIINIQAFGNFAGCLVPTAVITGLGLGAVLGNIEMTDPMYTSLINYLYITYAIKKSVLFHLLQFTNLNFTSFPSPNVTTIQEIQFPQQFIVKFGGVLEGKLYTLRTAPFKFCWGNSLSLVEIQNYFFEFISKPKMDLLQQKQYLDTFPALNDNIKLTNLEHMNLKTALQAEQVAFTHYTDSVESNRVVEAKIFRDKTIRWLVVGSVILVVGVSSYYFLGGSPTTKIM